MPVPAIAGIVRVLLWSTAVCQVGAVANADAGQNIVGNGGDLNGTFNGTRTQQSGAQGVGTYAAWVEMSLARDISSSGSAIVAHFRILNRIGIGKVGYVLFSNPSLTEYRIYDDLPAMSDWLEDIWYPVVLGQNFTSQTAGFDPSSIVAVGNLLTNDGSSLETFTFHVIQGDIFYISPGGVSLEGGEVGNPANLEQLRQLVNALYNTSGAQLKTPIEDTQQLSYASDFPVSFNANVLAESGKALICGGPRSFSEYSLGIAAQSSNVDGLTIIGSTLLQVAGASTSLDNFAFYDDGSGEFIMAAGALTSGTVLRKSRIRITGGFLNGVVFSDSAVVELATASLGSSQLTIRNPISAALRIEFAAGDYRSLNIDVPDGSIIQLSGGGGVYNFSGFTSSGQIIFDAVDGGSYTITVGSGVSAIAQPVQTNGSVEIVTPANEINVSGIPNVANAVLAVQNLTTFAVSYPALINGSATIPLDSGTNYKLSADAPGHLRQSVTLPGTTPAFVFDLEDFRALYDSGVDRGANVSFDYQTFAVTINDLTPELSFADIFRTIEDYLSTQQGVLFDYPPRPVVVDLGGGSARNYLFFPFDTAQGQVNPVRIRPNPTNTSDPTLTNFVIVLEGATSPIFDIFDFTGAGGRTIRFQTEAVAASVEVSGSGALTAAQAQQLTDLAAILESAGVLSSAALVNAPADATAVNQAAILNAISPIPTNPLLATDIRLSNLNAPVSGIPTIAEFNARTLPSSDYFDPAADLVVVGGYNTGQSPGEAIDLSQVLAAAQAPADGRTVLDIDASTYTIYNSDGTERTIFDLYQADGATKATTAAEIAERRPRP